MSLTPGAVGLDVGCGNGKNLMVNRDVFIIASDRYVLIWVIEFLDIWIFYRLLYFLGDIISLGRCIPLAWSRLTRWQIWKSGTDCPAAPAAFDRGGRYSWPPTPGCKLWLCNFNRGGAPSLHSSSASPSRRRDHADCEAWFRDSGGREGPDLRLGPRAKEQP